MNKEIALPKAITPGTKVQLMRQAFKDVKVKEWEFWGVEEGEIILFCRQGLILKVMPEDIDWQSIE